MPSARHRRHPRHRDRPRRRAPVALAAVLVAGCGIWGWSTREAPPSPSVASAPVDSGRTPPDPGSAAPRATGPGTTAEEDVAFVQDLLVLEGEAVVMAGTLDGSDPEVADLADRVRSDADAERQALVDWLRAHGAEVPDEADDPAATDPDGHPDLPGGISGRQLDSLRSAHGSDADRLFLGLLLTQDEATAARAEEQGRGTGDAGLRDLARSVHRDRTVRLAQATAMLERLT